MKSQTVSTEMWQAQLPEDWTLIEGTGSSIYFESPDGAAGAYFLAWRVFGRSLDEAVQDTRASERRALPETEEGQWEIVRSSAQDDAHQIDGVVEYFNRRSCYRIASRILGRRGYCVRLAYHDYYCTDFEQSAEQSVRWVTSLTLLAPEDVGPQ